MPVTALSNAAPFCHVRESEGNRGEILSRQKADSWNLAVPLATGRPLETKVEGRHVGFDAGNNSRFRMNRFLGAVRTRNLGAVRSRLTFPTALPPHSPPITASWQAEGSSVSRPQAEAPPRENHSPEPFPGIFSRDGSSHMWGGGGDHVSPQPTPRHPTVQIHPLSVVHPDAVLGEGCQVGPFCTLGPHVVLGHNCHLSPGCHLAGHTQLGDNCTLLSGACVGADIPGSTLIGRDNRIGHHAVVGARCQDLKYVEGTQAWLRVGDGNDIREHCSIHRSSKPDDVTVIGSRNLLMGACHVAHDCKMGDGNILANATLLGGHVVMENWVHTGGGVAVHQFCHLGSHSFLAGGAMVVLDVPSFAMVAGDRAELRGINDVGMKRCGFSETQVAAVRKAYQKLFMGSGAQESIETKIAKMEADDDVAKHEPVLDFLASVKASFCEDRRGLCAYKRWV